MIHKGMHHVSLMVCGEAQFKTALDFYSTFLACPVVRRWGEGDGQGALLDAGGVLLELLAHGGTEQKGAFAHIAFATDDVDASVEQMRKAGFAVLKEPKSLNLGGNYPIRIAFCRGPVGEEIEFFHEQL